MTCFEAKTKKSKKVHCSDTNTPYSPQWIRRIQALTSQDIHDGKVADTPYPRSSIRRIKRRLAHLSNILFVEPTLKVSDIPY